jgi:hypothetical protein
VQPLEIRELPSSGATAVGGGLVNRRQREERAIFRFVFLLNATAEGETFVSSFRAAIREARTLTGRDEETGAPKIGPTGKRLPPTDWSGALVY